jgi:hypothetical protein
LGIKEKPLSRLRRKAASSVYVILRGFPYECGYNDHHKKEKNHKEKKTKHGIVA